MESRLSLKTFAWATLFVALALTCGRAAGAPVALTEIYGNLEGTWAFQTDPADVGETAGWAAPDFDDAGWRTLEVPGSWEPQGVTEPRPGCEPKPKDGLAWTDYDGVAWYRLHVAIPESWGGQELVLYLGSVDDEDRAYFNGQRVGETGPGLERAVVVRRRYTIPADLVRAGGENVIAVRVTDGGGPGGLMGPNPYLLPKARIDAMTTLLQSDRPLNQRFAVPPAESRILKIVHSLPDASDAQDVLFQSLIGQGFGGIVTNVSFAQYLESDEKWAAFVRGVEEAKRLGMALWLYDEKGYPSGTAGGITMRDHPEWEARGLLIADTGSEGGPVALDVPPGSLVRAAALPVTDGVANLEQAVDLSSSIADGKLSWEAPAGSWQVMVITESPLYEGTHAAVSLADKLPYVNLLMAEPTARFIEVTYGGYTQHLGDDLGRWFIATFTDEPSLMSLFMRPQSYRVLPWSPGFAAAFLERRGYDVAPLLPALVAEAGPKGEAVRYDFWQTVGELVSENFFGQIQTWCRQHNVPSGGHLLCEESFVADVPLYGNFFQCIRRLDAPSIDCLTSIPSEVPWYVARLLSSAGELEGKTTTMCETSDHSQHYRPAGDTRPVREVTEDEIRGTCNRLIVNGITTITSYYSFSGLSTPQMNHLNEWIGRCCTMLKGGRQVTDVALLYPVESVWPHFSPAHNWVADSPETAHRVERTYRTASKDLYASRRDFTYIDARTLAEGKTDGGVLEYGPMQWRVVVLPCADTLPLAAWENLARFWRGGGAVIALTARPANSEHEFPSARVQALADEMFGTGVEPGVVTNAAGGAGVFLPAGSEALLPMLMDALIEPDVRADASGALGAPGAPLRVTHRRIDDHEVYFLINDSGEPWEGLVHFAAAGQAERWDPATGGSTPMYPETDGMRLALGPYGGMFFRFTEARAPKRLPMTAGTFPALEFASLPEVTPGLGKGEFVQGEILAEENGWRAKATLTKSDVDTFLFATLDYPQPLDFSDAACLSFEVSVPEGQRTATSLLVILHDANGADYLAHTGRPLASAGTSRCIVYLSQFEHAGWSKPSAALDRAAIAGIRIGWGGYLGKEGEQIEFALSRPQLGRIHR